MTPEFVIQLLRNALVTTLWLSAPLLIAALVVGVVISLLQVVTSLQDAAIGAVPRLVALVAVCLISLPWMLRKITAYTIAILSDFAKYAG